MAMVTSEAQMVTEARVVMATLEDQIVTEVRVAMETLEGQMVMEVLREDRKEHHQAEVRRTGLMAVAPPIME